MERLCNIIIDGICYRKKSVQEKRLRDNLTRNVKEPKMKKEKLQKTLLDQQVVMNERTRYLVGPEQNVGRQET